MLREYLKNMVRLRETMEKPSGFKYSCIEEYVLENGRPYEPASMPEALHKELMSMKTMPIKQCFANCQEIAILDDRFTYVEGYASSIIPTLHAWLEIEGHLFDPTWRPVSAGTWKDREYFGVRFSDTESIRRRVLESEWFTTILDDWQNDYPLLRGEDSEQRRLEVTVGRGNAPGADGGTTDVESGRGEMP